MYLVIDLKKITNYTSLVIDSTHLAMINNVQQSLNLHISLFYSYSGVIWQCADMTYQEFKNKYEELKWLMNGDKVSATNKLKEYDQRLKIELSLKEKNVSAYESLTARNKLVESRFATQMQLIDHKIKEVERIRLYLRVCEINSHGVDNADLDEFFSKKDCERKQQRWVIWSFVIKN